MPADKQGKYPKDSGNDVQTTTSWRQTIRREVRTAQAFEPTWGYLRAPKPAGGPRPLTRRASTISGEDKREAGQQLLQTIKKNGGQLPARLNAERAAGLTHAMRTEHIKLNGNRYDTSNSAYGQRLNIEPASQQRGRPSGFRSRGRDQSAFSNLQSFLVHTSPCVPVSSTEVAQDSSAEPAPASEDVFRLADVWQSFESWSAFGAEVPLQVSADQEQVTQCYVPYLSALQLFEKAAPQSRDPVPSVPPPSSCFSDDDLIEPLSSNVSTASSSLSTDSDSEDGKLGPSPARLSHGSVLRPIPSDPKKVIFEFYETVGPHLRDPLTSRIEQLSKECPDLVNLDSSSIHPASWVSIAWYPIYSIPSNGQRLSDLGACFLTFHSLALPSRHMGPWQGSAVIRSAVIDRHTDL
ncbi:hypothetical protein WJX84_003442 [Apatococcus fuscideae]|uniref:Uncharacterized protein n=1 Tax=Apatococcus fuscideae TaxID=2026836 RepID=A0AAW1TCI4_9CHLO